METVAMELMDVMFSALEALPGQDAFPGAMDLEHVSFGFGLVPPKNHLEDVGDIVHEIDWIVPTNNQIPWIQARARGGRRFGNNLRTGWCAHDPTHGWEVKIPR
jgi:hypothetical protein